jgi:hypothetical protein
MPLQELHPGELVESIRVRHQESEKALKLNLRERNSYYPNLCTLPNLQWTLEDKSGFK